MSSPAENARRIVAPSDEHEVIVVRLTDDRAIVVDAPSETTWSRWGRKVADITTGELASLLRTLDPAMKSFIESRRLAGGLVELDEISRRLWSTAEVITEKDGWVQATIRNRGKVARLMRIRPISGIAAMSGAAAILGAVAAQAQAAEIARDIKAIRQRVDEISKDLRDDLTGEVNSAVEQVDELVLILRRHGRNGIEAGTIPTLRNELRKAVKKCRERLHTALVALEHAKEQRAPRRAAKILSEEAVVKTTLYLDLVGQLYAATVQLGLAQIALGYHEGKVDVANTQAELIVSSADSVRIDIEAALNLIAYLDVGIRARFRPDRWYGVPAMAAVVPTITYPARKLAGATTIRVPGLPIPIPPAAAITVASALPSVVLGANAWLQSNAEKELNNRLTRLKHASDRSFRSLQQVTAGLEVLRTSPEQVAGPGQDVG